MMLNGVVENILKIGVDIGIVVCYNVSTLREVQYRRYEMKLDNLYNDVANKVVACIPEQMLIDHVRAVQNSGRYKNLTVRIAHDIKNVVFSPATICEWYDKYNCNDNHMTTLFKKVIRENYKVAWDIIQEA